MDDQRVVKAKDEDGKGPKVLLWATLLLLQGVVPQLPGGCRVSGDDDATCNMLKLELSGRPRPLSFRKESNTNISFEMRAYGIRSACHGGSYTRKSYRA